MDYNLTANQVKDIVDGTFLKDSDHSFTGISTDSRNILSTELFVPLVGENFDGHNFIDSVVKKEIKGIITQKNINTDSDIAIIKVENTLKAYQKLATYHRKEINPFVIGITGSSGKTSTKEIAYAFFSQFFETYKSKANFNNEVGVPLNLLSLEKKHKLAIIEMGMRGEKQIEELAFISKPNAGIITGIGSAHIELLGSMEKIAQAKWELSEYLKCHDSYLAVPLYDPHLKQLIKNYPLEKLLTIDIEKNEEASFYLLNHWIENDKQYFNYFDNINKKEHRACLSVFGKHQISNALLVIALAKVLEIELPDFIDISFENLSGRSETTKIENVTIVNDSYNANPESMQAAIETFLDVYKGKENILVLGEMRELGEYSQLFHKKIGDFAKGFDFKEIIIIGKNARPIFEAYDKDNSKFFENNQSAAQYLKIYLEKDVNMFFKASRGAQLEEVIEDLIK